MGCGASSAVQISPAGPGNRFQGDNRSLRPVQNGYPPKSSFFKNFNNKVVANDYRDLRLFSVFVQTESDLNGIKTQYTQTDVFLFSEEELSVNLDETLESSSDNCEPLNSGEQCYSNSDVSWDVIKDKTSFTEETISQVKSKKVQQTSDVGVQATIQKMSAWTQVRCSVKDHNLNKNNSSKNSVLFEVPKMIRLNYNNKYNNNRNEIGGFKRSMSLDVFANKTMIKDYSLKAKNQEFEAQSDSFITILADNSAEQEQNDLSLRSFESSPIHHIEKELMKEKVENINNFKLQNSIVTLLEEMNIDEPITPANQQVISVVPKTNASVQTDNDPITDESPEFAARPPPCKKREMIPTLAMFKEVDRRATGQIPDTVRESPAALAKYLCKDCINDLHKVRAIFSWITQNISYDWKYQHANMETDEILKACEGVSKDYCKLFSDLCTYARIRVKTIEGFAKGQDFRPAHRFLPGQDIHKWNAVYILGAWRLIDTTWGTGFTDHSGKFQRKLNEHFFLTDPEHMIWTHFPYNGAENNYSRWQLLDKPLSLDEFNLLPKVTPSFFEYNLKIRSKKETPLIFRISTEIKIGSHETMRYKFKLYSSEEVENSSLNYYVFCQLKEDRLVGSFMVQPPLEGMFFLKIFARPEREMQEMQQDTSSLQNVVTFLLECTRARKYIEPFPINELPWGPTQIFFDYKLRFHNQNGPVIVTWGGKRKLVLEGNETLLVSYQVFDANGMEMDTRNIITREDSGNRITFIINPPRVGTFKMILFGMPKPKQKGKWRLPLLASFLIDCKLVKPPQYDEDPPLINSTAQEETSGQPRKSSKSEKKLMPIMMR